MQNAHCTMYNIQFATYIGAIISNTGVRDINKQNASCLTDVKRKYCK